MYWIYNRSYYDNKNNSIIKLNSNKYTFKIVQFRLSKYCQLANIVVPEVVACATWVYRQFYAWLFWKHKFCQKEYIVLTSKFFFCKLQVKIIISRITMCCIKVRQCSTRECNMFLRREYIIFIFQMKGELRFVIVYILQYNILQDSNVGFHCWHNLERNPVSEWNCQL